MIAHPEGFCAVYPNAPHQLLDDIRKLVPPRESPETAIDCDPKPAVHLESKRRVGSKRKWNLLLTRNYFVSKHHSSIVLILENYGDKGKAITTGIVYKKGFIINRSLIK